MNRPWKQFAVVLLAWFLASGGAMAEEPLPWTLVRPPQPTDHPDKIVVYELFWYACPHCRFFEPKINQWSKNAPDDVIVEKVPAVFSGGRQNHFTKAYFAAKALGILDKVHAPLFHEYHVEKNRMNSLEELADFIAQFGVDKETFKKTYKSFGVDMELRKAAKMTRDFAVSGVPTVVIDGKYRLVGSRINGYDAMLGVMDQVVDLVRQERAAAKVKKAQTTAKPADPASHPQ